MGLGFDPRPDVPCGAIVDRLDMHTGGGVWRWHVQVVTPRWWPTRIKRDYYIDAPSDTLAAQEGIRRFVEEAKRPGPSILTTVH